MTVYEMAEKYYPRLWGRERLEALKTAGKLSQEEYRSLVGEETEHEA